MLIKFSDKRKIVSDGNMGLQRGIKYTKTSNYMGKYKRMAYYYLKVSLSFCLSGLFLTAN